MSQDSLYHIFSLFISWTLSHVLPQNQIRDYRLKLNLNIIGSDIIAILQASSYDQKELKLYTCQEKHFDCILGWGLGDNDLSYLWFLPPFPQWAHHEQHKYKVYVNSSHSKKR